jgi:NAD(P)-dependent dehydrogenase (short-subunit alcohol dehydrogenase family)
MDIKGTGAVVTGAGSGIGRGIALALAEAGARDIAAFAYMLVRDEFFETGQIWNYSGGNSLLGHPRFLA